MGAGTQLPAYNDNPVGIMNNVYYQEAIVFLLWRI